MQLYGTMTRRLITIGPSHYCDKAKKALMLAKLDFKEEAHLPFFHAPAVIGAGGVRSTPALALDGQTLGDSSDILAYIHEHPEAAWHPYGDSPELRSEIEAWETLFDEKVGPHTRRLAYFLLLPIKQLAIPIMTYGAPSFEKKAVNLAYPMFRALMQTLLNVNAPGAERSRAKLQELFDQVAIRLDAQPTSPSGQRYLVGTELSAADLTFATLAAPILGMQEYFPEALRPIVWPEHLESEFKRWRAHPAGKWAIEVYQELSTRCA